MSEPVVILFTNLDEAKPYVNALSDDWIGPVPSVGHDISIRIRDRKHFRLRVVAVTWLDSGVTAEVELHMRPGLESIHEWSEWFKQWETEP